MGRVLFVGKHGREAVARDDELLLRAFLGISLSSHPFHVYSLQLQVNSNCAFIPVTGMDMSFLVPPRRESRVLEIPFPMARGKDCILRQVN